jgi:hypothetical protein
MSQLKQDQFALQASQHKTYIEIGAAYPRKINNTFLLEKQGWKGFHIELNELNKPSWDEDPERNNTIYWDNAITFDYAKACKDNNLPKRIGYLSVDIEPPENTYAALRQVIEQGISFDCITFEHDKYHSNEDYDPIVTEYLKNHGYKVAVENVYKWRKFRLDPNKPKINKKCYLETWYVNTDIEFEKVDYDNWLGV